MLIHPFAYQQGMRCETDDDRNILFQFESFKLCTFWNVKGTHRTARMASCLLK